MRTMPIDQGGEVLNSALDEWRRLLAEDRRDLEARRRDIEEEALALNERLERLDEDEAIVKKAMQAITDRMKAGGARSAVRGENMREILIINYASPDGVIRGSEAASGLYKRDYFKERRSADGAVYTALAKPPFIKVEKGVYQIPTDSPEWIRLRESNGHQPQMPVATAKPKKFVKSGLGDAVTDILAEHPNWNRRVVTNYLRTSGWDFGGKNPNFAVSMAFSRLAKKANAEAMPPGRGFQSQPAHRRR